MNAAQLRERLTRGARALRREWLVVLGLVVSFSTLLLTRAAGWPDLAAVVAGAVAGVLTVRLVERGRGPRA